MTLDLKALEKVANIANDAAYDWSIDEHGPCHQTFGFIGDNYVTKPAADYIATFNPGVVLEMIAEIRRLRAENTALGAFVKQFNRYDQ